MSSLRALPVAAVVLALGCVEAVPPGPTVVQAPVAVVASQPDPLASFAGVYSIVGRPSSDGCAGQIYLAARTFVVDAGARTLFADVVNRTYAARVEGGLLIAEGNFEDDATCAESQIFERWVLSRQADGSLAGALDSLWPLPPECGNPCLVRFSVAALPAQQ